MKIHTIRIRKPLYGNYCYINGDKLNKAIREGAKLEITLPNGSAVVDPQEWKNNRQIMKKVFKFANNPMILYGGWVPIPPPKGEVIETKEKEEVKKEKEQPTLF